VTHKTVEYGTERTSQRSIHHMMPVGLEIMSKVSEGTLDGGKNNDQKSFIVVEEAGLNDYSPLIKF